MKRLNKVRTRDTKFTRVFNEIIQDKSLTWKARGIFMYLWSMPDDWKFRESEVVRHATDGMSALRSGLHELEQNHYLVIRYHTNDPKVPVGDSHWYLSDKKILNCDFQGSKTEVQSSNIDNQNLQTTNKQTTDKSTTNLTNSTDNGESRIRKMIVKDLESLMVNINTFVSDDIDDWIKHYDPKLILKAIHQVGSTSPSPAWVVKDISTQLSRGCKVHQPKRHSGTYQSYGRPVIHQKLPKWARNDYHPKLHPASPKLIKKVQKHFKEMQETEKKFRDKGDGKK